MVVGGAMCGGEGPCMAGGHAWQEGEMHGGGEGHA